MTAFTKYGRLLAIQARTSLMLGMQYRLDFLVEGAVSIFWVGVTLIPLVVVFGKRPTVAGWTYDEALLVVGMFVLLKGVLEGAITPSLLAVVDHIRKGTLDFVLLKPADAQFLVSTTKFQPWSMVDVIGGLVVIVAAFVRMGTQPSPLQVAVSLAILASAVLVLYSIWILVVSLAFFVVRVDNLSYLFTSIFDAARWPITVFRGPIRFAFTFVLPLAVMTTYPSMALLGTLEARVFVASTLGATAFAVFARQVWKQAIRRYTSASS